MKNVFKSLSVLAALSLSAGVACADVNVEILHTVVNKDALSHEKNVSYVLVVKNEGTDAISSMTLMSADEHLIDPVNDLKLHDLGAGEQRIVVWDAKSSDIAMISNLHLPLTFFVESHDLKGAKKHEAVNGEHIKD